MPENVIRVGGFDDSESVQMVTEWILTWYLFHTKIAEIVNETLPESVTVTVENLSAPWLRRERGFEQ